LQEELCAEAQSAVDYPSFPLSSKRLPALTLSTALTFPTMLLF